jgi:hypothetical protein
MWTRAPRHTGVAAAAHGPDMEFDANAARAYIRGVRWQFARTMPQWPHEYTVRDWCLELEPEFIAFVALIRRTGTAKPWPPEASTPRYRNTYLELDGREYWTMGSPIPATTVINRAHLARPPARRRSIERPITNRRTSRLSHLSHWGREGLARMTRSLRLPRARISGGTRLTESSPRGPAVGSPAAAAAGTDTIQEACASQ